MREQSGLFIALGAFVILVTVLRVPLVDRDHDGVDDSTQMTVHADGYIYVQKASALSEATSIVGYGNYGHVDWSTTTDVEDVDEDWVRFPLTPGNPTN